MASMQAGYPARQSANSRADILSTAGTTELPIAGIFCELFCDDGLVVAVATWEILGRNDGKDDDSDSDEKDRDGFLRHENCGIYDAAQWGFSKVRDGVKPVPRARMAGQDRIRVLFMVVLVGVAVVLWCFGCGGDPCSRSNDPGLMATLRPWLIC